jgi:hypothetical protein
VPWLLPLGMRQLLVAADASPIGASLGPSAGQTEVPTRSATEVLGQGYRALISGLSGPDIRLPSDRDNHPIPCGAIGLCYLPEHRAPRLPSGPGPAGAQVDQALISPAAPGSSHPDNGCQQGADREAIQTLISAALWAIGLASSAPDIGPIRGQIWCPAPRCRGAKMPPALLGRRLLPPRAACCIIVRPAHRHRAHPPAQQRMPCLGCTGGWLIDADGGAAGRALARWWLGWWLLRWRWWWWLGLGPHQPGAHRHDTTCHLTRTGCGRFLHPDQPAPAHPQAPLRPRAWPGRQDLDPAQPDT